MARISSGLIEFTAVVGADELVHTLSPTKRAIIKKIRWHNRVPANGMLRVGYLNPAAVFVQVLPDILMTAGVDDALNEADIPIVGNGPEGFVADTTAGTGTTGDIYCESTVAGAAGVNVHVVIEVEEIP